jgi:hypothetical protein
MVLLPEDPALVALPNTGKAPGYDCRRPSACQAGLRGGATVGRQVVKSCLSVATEMGERFDMDQIRV